MKNVFNQIGMCNSTRDLGGENQRKNPHRACYTRKRKSAKLRNYDRWCRNNQPWLGGNYV